MWITAFAGMTMSNDHAVSAGLDRLGHRGIAFPALVFEHELLDGDVGAIGVERRQRLVEGRPAAIDFIGEHELSRLVVELEVDVLAKVGERNLAPE